MFICMYVFVGLSQLIQMPGRYNFKYHKKMQLNYLMKLKKMK